MGSVIGGGSGVGARVALLGTVFASLLVFALPAQAAQHTTHHPVRHVVTHHTVAHHTVRHHVAARHVVVRHHVVSRHAAAVHHTEKRHVAVRRTKHHVAPTAKARLRRDHHMAELRGNRHSKSGKARYTRAHYTGISCVPFARAASGIELKGNATNWWDAAAGIYARGARPEVGAVLNFRSTGRMRLGHVAVVAKVINSREIEINHANWAGPGARKGQITRGIKVVDVSPRNNWSAVRVELGHRDSFGSVYPTYGFIYDRPDRGMMVANTLAPAHGGILPAPNRHDAVEVAEAPLHGRGSVNVVDAPTRTLR